MPKRIYDNDYPSVTGVLNVLRKIGLEVWFKNNTAEFCNAESKKGLAVGKILHEIISSQIEKTSIEIETEYLEEVKIALKSFMLFKKENPEIKLKKSEIPCTSEKYKFNGTPDCNGMIKTPIIFDWKTSKCNVGKKKETDIPRIYDEHLYQVSAYVVLYNEVMKTNITQAGIVAIAKDKVAYNYLLLTESAIKENFNEAFLPALKILNHQNKQKEESKNGKTITKGRQGIGSNSKGIREHSSKSSKLPTSF